MTNDGQSPTSWRDVYALVRDGHTDLMAVANAIDGKVDKLGERVTDIEQDRRTERAVAQTVATKTIEQNNHILRLLGGGRQVVLFLFAVVIGVMTVLDFHI